MYSYLFIIHILFYFHFYNFIFESFYNNINIFYIILQNCTLKHYIAHQNIKETPSLSNNSCSLGH